MASDNQKKHPASTSATASEKRIRPERRAESDRRATAERRQAEKPVAVERRVKERRTTAEGGERRKVERRINEYPMQPDVLEFINAINEFKTVQQKPFPTWSDIYGIFVNLGYRRE